MHLLILATGRTRDKHILALEADYARRFPLPWTYELRELKASTSANATQAKKEEAEIHQAALTNLAPETFVIALDETGQSFSSQAFSQQLQQVQNNGHRTVALLIGGASGLMPQTKARANLVWSLSPLTMPHQLVRVMLAEQLYRAYTLLTNHPYHRN